MNRSLHLRATLLSLVLFAAFVGTWQIATMPRQSGGPVMDPEYARLVGAAAAAGEKSTFPTPAEVGAMIWQHLSDPFYIRGTNDQGIGV